MDKDQESVRNKRKILSLHCNSCGTDTPCVQLFQAKEGDAVPKTYRITEEEHSTCWDIWRCRTCGLTFSDCRLSPESIQNLYVTMEDAVYEREDFTRRLTFRRGLTLLETCMLPAKSKGLLLDIGCATGGFLQEAKDRGWQVEGVDLSHWAVSKAHERGIPAVHRGTIHSLPGTPERFDAVTMLDYIEHDQDTSRLLSAVQKVIRKGGCLYITTPDIGSFVAKLLGRRWWGINPLHLYYFSRSSLGKMLEKHGFEIVLMRSYTRVFTLGYWASRLEHFHPALALVVGTPIKWLHMSNWPIPLNLGDMMEVVARKR